jgi:hypothetical protein
VQPDHSDHVAVSKWVMYIIAGMILACLTLVLVAKGVDAMPFKYYGVVGALIFMTAAISMAFYVKRQHH